jgi:hypothetical protein
VVAILPSSHRTTTASTLHTRDLHQTDLLYNGVYEADDGKEAGRQGGEAMVQEVQNLSRYVQSDSRRLVRYVYVPILCYFDICSVGITFIT